MDSVYNAAEYPQGVPSPFTGQVHPYPSYEHGPDYTRPTFGMPFVRQPYNVMAGLGEGPWRPRVNREGLPIVQPQPNPYYPHWPQVLGTTAEDDKLRGALYRGYLTAFGVGAALGALGVALGAERSTAGAVLGGAVAGGLGTVFLAFAPVAVTAYYSR